MTRRSPEEAIRANADLVVDKFRSLSELGAHFGYNRESVAWIEGFIERERRRPELTPSSTAKLVQTLGSYLGECIIYLHGGVWREREGTWGVFFDDANAVFPFSKIQKQFQDGLEGGDSVLSFFDLIDPVILRKRGSSSVEPHK
jgi:hypothetical protein